MRIFLILPDVENVLGPGHRLCIWTMGCSKHCPGCVSPDARAFDPASNIDVIAKLKELDYSIATAVTISGGEPFEQSEELDQLTAFLAERFDDILVYTGKLYEELLQDPAATRVLQRISCLVDGPYIAEQNENEKLRGSSNQRILVFKKQYEASYLAFNKEQRDPAFYSVGPATFGVGLPRHSQTKKEGIK
jgi:anaerobic ribonucleoside-triphosphate reductase activating protein